MPPVLGMKFYKISKKLLSTGNKSKYQKKNELKVAENFQRLQQQNQNIMLMHLLRLTIV